jgi:hypothetical protein
MFCRSIVAEPEADNTHPPNTDVRNILNVTLALTHVVIITCTALIFTDVFRLFEKHFTAVEPNFYYGCNSDNLFLLPTRTKANTFFQTAQFSHIHPLLIQIQQCFTIQPQCDWLSAHRCFFAAEMFVQISHHRIPMKVRT